MDDEFHDTIEGLEQRIEALAAETLRCRKFALAARILITAGMAALALMLVGLLTYTPEMMIAALAAVIGGVVLLGSNASTWEQTEGALEAAEATRRELIARIELRVVGEERPTLH
jgi:hypothetical protein